jgi:type I restriction enzyme S subunit
LIKYRKISEICKIFSGNSINEKIKKEKYSKGNDGIEYISTKDIGYDLKINYKNGVKIPHGDLDKFRIAPPNTVFICAEGGSAGRKLAISDRQLCFVNKLFAIVSCEKVLPKFIFYFIQSENFNKKFKSAITGLIGGVSLNKFKEFEIPILTILDQERIVAKLDKIFAEIDKVIVAAEANVMNVEILFKSYLNKLFDSDNKNWDKKKLKEISIYVGRGKSKHRPRDDKSLYGGVYPFIQTGDVRNSKKYITVYNQTYNEKGLSQSRLWKANTICITIAANIAEVGILSFDACFPDSLIGITVDQKKINEEFLYFMLLHKQQLIKSKSKGSAQENINLKTFEDMFFMVPQKDEQDKIVKQLNHLFKLSNSITNIQLKKVSELILLKQSILQQAFNGELVKAA